MRNKASCHGIQIKESKGNKLKSVENPPLLLRVVVSRVVQTQLNGLFPKSRESLRARCCEEKSSIFQQRYHRRMGVPGTEGRGLERACVKEIEEKCVKRESVGDSNGWDSHGTLTH